VDEKTPTGSHIEPKGVQSSSETPEGGSEIRCRPKFWRVVVATTTVSYKNMDDFLA